ncbi:hypothetical protein CI610_03623 [invertebrate metagenome]|uniref:Uncharacterized protein n=1 Tax=invertebrate metagenome TaxID=1711999 RepID=A0A2H9T2N9_9ZZZZ
MLLAQGIMLIKFFVIHKYMKIIFISESLVSLLEVSCAVNKSYTFTSLVRKCCLCHEVAAWSVCYIFFFCLKHMMPYNCFCYIYSNKHLQRNNCQPHVAINRLLMLSEYCHSYLSFRQPHSKVEQKSANHIDSTIYFAVTSLTTVT